MVQYFLQSSEKLCRELDTHKSAELKVQHIVQIKAFLTTFISCSVRMPAMDVRRGVSRSQC